ncbi:MAG TPA: tetratricopeptide repeat protein [Gemmatimonadota bacterium]|jgi:tetratricopeptide (TPR) repeat protein
MSRSWPIVALAIGGLALPPAAPAIRAQPLEAVDAAATSGELFHIALEARRRGDQRFAAAILERVVRMDPTAVLPRLEWAETLLVLREPELVDALLLPLAERIEAEAAERPDSAARFYRLRGNAAARAGRKTDAIELYERAIELSPYDLGLRSLLVSMYRSRADAPATARHLVAAAELRPGDADLRVEAGRALLALDRYDEAEAEFRMALEIDLWAVPAWQGLGEALAGQERWADAEEVYRGGIRLAPESAALHELLGDALLAGGRFKEALIWFTRASALQSADPAGLRRKIERVQAQLEP